MNTYHQKPHKRAKSTAQPSARRRARQTIQDQSSRARTSGAAPSRQAKRTDTARGSTSTHPRASATSAHTRGSATSRQAQGGGARQTRSNSTSRQGTARNSNTRNTMPSWYDPSRASNSRKPQAALDISLTDSRWYSSGKNDIYVNGKVAHRRQHNRRLKLVGTGLCLVVLLVAVGFGVMGALGSNEQAATPEDQLAANDATQTSTTLTLSFAGDCTLGTDEAFNYSTSFNAKYDEVDDPAWFFANVVDLFKADDLTIVNMEGTLTEATSRSDKTFAFKGSADYAQVLVKGDVEAASMANNHSHDYGQASYTDTIEALESAKIATFGYDRIAYQDVKGVKVALIGAYELAEGIDMKDDMVDLVKQAQDEGAQLIAVYIHWGIEKDTVPTETQVELGHAAVDAGADLVIGSHPHVIQGYEKYHGRYIVYSLGNFCFGGNSNPSDKDCMIFQQTFTVTGDEVDKDDNITVIPCSISSTSSSNNYQPTPATGDEKDRITTKIETSNKAIAKLSEQVSEE